MLIYNLNLALIAIWGAIFCIYRPNKIKKAAFLLLSYSQMAILLICRTGIGYDYISYKTVFSQCVETSFQGYLNTAKTLLSNDLASVTEPGYFALCKVIGKVTQDPDMFYTIMAILMMAAVALFMFFFSKMPVISTIAFISLTFYYSMFSQLRQVTALIIVMYAWPFLKKRRVVPYMLVILLAASFHYTALLMVPIYFICNIRPTAKALVVYASTLIVLYFSLGYIVDFITKYVYKAYTEESIYMQSMSPVFIIVPALIMIAALVFKDRLMGAAGYNRILINMSIYSFMIWTLITKHLLLERLSWYPYVFMVLLLPELIMSFAPTEKMKEHRKELLDESTQQAAGQGADGKRKKPKTYGGKRKAVVEIERKIKEATIRKWAAAAAVIIVLYAYNVFGMYHGDFGFHGIFPYATDNEILSEIPGTMKVPAEYDRFLRYHEP